MKFDSNLITEMIYNLKSIVNEGSQHWMQSQFIEVFGIDAHTDLSKRQILRFNELVIAGPMLFFLPDRKLCFSTLSSASIVHDSINFLQPFSFSPELSKQVIGKDGHNPAMRP
jgi:hypothetical protein